jgi:hypothetical protein
VAPNSRSEYWKEALGAACKAYDFFPSIFSCPRHSRDANKRIKTVRPNVKRLLCGLPALDISHAWSNRTPSGPAPSVYKSTYDVSMIPWKSIKRFIFKSCVHLSSKEIMNVGLHDGGDTVLRYMHKYTAMQNRVWQWYYIMHRYIANSCRIPDGSSRLHKCSQLPFSVCEDAACMISPIWKQDQEIAET